MPELTPFQTVGPFFAILPLAGESNAAGPGAPGPRIVVSGVVRDGDGAVVPDALIETWQADGTEPGFARAPSDETGRFAITTVKPRPVPGPGGTPQAPHLVVGVLARGILTRLVTRIYFEDESANASDPILAMVPPKRRATLVARAVEKNHYQLDIVLQGPAETVFFDV